ncbi:hypothetical protein AFM12_06200 [Jiulongibacter sediminis]|uniref:Uncharacterized protein n=1 Tax=Jiulongibacter sediminis TaxID=1605367 RepID=A0A0P7C2H5_9BACT|nr:hypothetical protein AFM12_06200 [Jiulongibacter sediminis]TBX24791.1 hypothetical protein TK44_06205 [Jiulongibacter sediminis]
MFSFLNSVSWLVAAQKVNVTKKYIFNDTVLNNRGCKKNDAGGYILLFGYNQYQKSGKLSP